MTCDAHPETTYSYIINQWTGESESLYMLPVEPKGHKKYVNIPSGT